MSLAYVKIYEPCSKDHIVSLFECSDFTASQVILIQKLEQQSMVHHRKYLLFYLWPLPCDQGHTKCFQVPSTSCDLRTCKVWSCYVLWPNKHGLVTYMQVNVYIGNKLSWLNGGWAFKTDLCWRSIIISPLFLCISLNFLQKQWFNTLSLKLYSYIYWKCICLYEHQQDT